MAQWFLVKLTTCGVAVIIGIVVVGMYVSLINLYHRFKPRKRLVYADDIQNNQTADPRKFNGFYRTPSIQRTTYPGIPPIIKEEFRVVELWNKYGTIFIAKAQVPVNVDRRKYIIHTGDNKFYTFRDGNLRKWCQTDITPGFIC